MVLLRGKSLTFYLDVLIGPESYYEATIINRSASSGAPDAGDLHWCQGKLSSHAGDARPPASRKQA